jgi:hypothetical protein
MPVYPLKENRLEAARERIMWRNKNRIGIRIMQEQLRDGVRLAKLFVIRHRIEADGTRVREPFPSNVVFIDLRRRYRVRRHSRGEPQSTPVRFVKSFAYS